MGTHGGASIRSASRTSHSCIWRPKRKVTRMASAYQIPSKLLSPKRSVIWHNHVGTRCFLYQGRAIMGCVAPRWTITEWRVQVPTSVAQRYRMKCGPLPNRGFEGVRPSPNRVKRTAGRYQTGSCSASDRQQTVSNGVQTVTKRRIGPFLTVSKRCQTDCRPLPNGELKMSVRYQTVNWTVSVRQRTESCAKGSCFRVQCWPPDRGATPSCP